MSEIYISTDVETDGPIPGPHAMLSVGSAAWKSESFGFKFMDDHLAGTMSGQQLEITTGYLASSQICFSSSKRRVGNQFFVY